VIPSSRSSGYSPEVSPFPLNVSPFVPTTASDAGEDTREAEVHHESGSGESGDSVADEDIQGGDGEGDEDRLLAASQSKTQVPKIERAYLQRIVQVDIDGVVNVMPGNLIDVIIAVSVSGVLSRVSLLFQG